MKTVNGDITKCTEGILLNGVNCQNVMGSGVAKAYYTKWPEVKKDYHEYCIESLNLYYDSPKDLLGCVDCICIIPKKLYVANCFTQEYYGHSGKYAFYSAIVQCFETVAKEAKCWNLEIKTPLIGAGLGGLKAEIVIEILEELEYIHNIPITLYRI